MGVWNVDKLVFVPRIEKETNSRLVKR